MRTLDLVYAFVRKARRGGRLPRGSWPRHRFDGVVESQRAAPIGLPINAYDQKWISGLSAARRKTLQAGPEYDFSHSDEALRSVQYLMRMRELKSFQALREPSKLCK